MGFNIGNFARSVVGSTIGGAAFGVPGTIGGALMGAKNPDGSPKRVGTDPNSLVNQGRAEGIATGEKRWGHTSEQAGQNIKDVAGRMEDRLDGGDPITEALKQQSTASKANAARQMAGRGVAGGAALAASEQAGKAKDIDVAASAYQQNAQNLKDYANLNSNIASNLGMEENMAINSRISSVKPEVAKQEKGLLSKMTGGIF